MQKISIPCIKTGDFARMCQTNKRTLFYYDEIGLFSPAFTDDNGYRYYSENQCDVFFTINCLSEIGMPLKEIKAYLDHKSPEDLKILLERKLLKVKEEQLRLRRIEQVIQTKLSLVNQGESLLLKSHCSPIYIEEMQEEYMVVSPLLDTDNHDTLIQALCTHIGFCSQHHLNAGHPYGAMISTSALKTGKWDTYSYFMTKVYDRPDGHPYHIKPAGTYAVVYLKGDYYDAKETYQELMMYFDEHHLTMGEYSYKEAVLDEISVPEVDDYVTRISIQITGSI